MSERELSAGARLESALEALYEQGATEADIVPDPDAAEVTGHRGHPMQQTADELEAVLGSEKSAQLAELIFTRLGMQM